MEDIDQLNLSYRVEKGVSGVIKHSGGNVVNEKDEGAAFEGNPESLVIQYIANNNTD